MIIVNKLENRSFGPFASSMGLFIFIAGLIIAYFSLSGLLMAIAGAFVAFTSTSTIIDTANRRIKHADYIFGLFPAGKWVRADPSMKLGIHKTVRGYRGYARGTQSMDYKTEDFRIFLYDSNNKQILPLRKFANYETAANELKNMASLLNLRMI